MDPQYDQVCLLLQTPFKKWKENDKKELLFSDKPTPILPLDGVQPGSKQVRHFRNSWYLSFPWLCGSHYIKKLFCWPCLIFGTKRNGVWSKIGFDSIVTPTRSFKVHEGSVDHLKNCLQLNNLCKTMKPENDVLKENSCLCIDSYNKKVFLNRQYMQLLIKAILFLIKQELSYTGHNIKHFKELLKMMLEEASAEIRQHYSTIQTVLEDDIVSIQNELINCIYIHLTEFIKNEVQESEFFAVEVNDTRDISHASQCSITIRYVNSKSLLVERFLGFHDASEKHTSDALVAVLETVLGPLCYQIKLIAQCYDGACIIQEQLFKLQTKVKSQVLQALFTYSSSHRLDIIIKQSLNSISECRIFFSILSGIPSLFDRLKERSYGFKFIVSKIPTSTDIRWSPNSKILRLVADEWNGFKNILKKILADPDLDQISIQQAHGLLNYFNDFGFMLLSLIFDVIFQLTDILCETLLKRNLDVSYCLQQVKETHKIISEQRNDETYQRFFEIAEAKTAIVLKNVDGYRTQAEVFQKFKELYFKILDTIIMELDTRFIDTERLKFFCLADSTKFKEYLANLPNDVVDSLETTYPNVIKNPSRLKNELKIIYEDTNYRDCTLQQIVKKLHNDGSKYVLQEVYKMFCLILTIPWNSSEIENSSCLKRIENYLRNSTFDGRQTLATLSIEQGLIDHLISTTPFYDDIINRFASLKDQKIDLIFKNSE